MSGGWPGGRHPAGSSVVRMMIHNPVLPGFNPDPCIFRDAERYYIAVSTFEWMPGVRVYASDDLAHWRYETSILDSPRMAALAGNPAGGSIWAPSMRWHNGRYYLVYTDAKNVSRPYKDSYNYITWAEDIHGPWSDPVYLNGAGFDPTIFFDDDGSMYYAHKILDYRLPLGPEVEHAGGIVIQRMDPETFALMGEPRKVFTGTKADKTEGPQIYKRDGWYYLIVAEGGTGWNHQITVTRSRSIWGPYEADPNTPLLTSKDDPALPFQCAGHGSLVESFSGDWYMAHLMTRPLPDKGSVAVAPRPAPLGRETSLQRVEWTDDGWLRLAHGGHHPAVDVPAPQSAPILRTEPSSGQSAPVILSAEPSIGRPAPVILSGARTGEVEGSLTSPHQSAFHDDFTAPCLDLAHWNTLREMPGDWLTCGGAQGNAAQSGGAQESALVIRGGASPRSGFDQHLVGIRRTDHDFEACVDMAYMPGMFLNAAGMLLYLDVTRYLFLAATCDFDGNPVIGLLEDRNGEFSLVGDFQPWSGSGRLTMRVRGALADFLVTDDGLVDSAGSAGPAESRVVAKDVDAGFLAGGFTGDFIALDCVDQNVRNATAATFRHFTYRPITA